MSYVENYDVPLAIEIDHLPSKSAKIRHLFENGKSRTEISKILNIRYQHVRNVLITPIKQ